MFDRGMAPDLSQRALQNPRKRGLSLNIPVSEYPRFCQRSSWKAAEMSPSLAPYIDAIDLFCDGKISALDFEQGYLAFFKQDATEWPPEEFDVLDRLFGAVVGFCADPSLRDEEDLDESQLRDACKTALSQLREFQNRAGATWL